MKELPIVPGCTCLITGGLPDEYIGRETIAICRDHTYDFMTDLEAWEVENPVNNKKLITVSEDLLRLDGHDFSHEKETDKELENV